MTYVTILTEQPACRLLHYGLNK